jgi:hypothetical protein
MTANNILGSPDAKWKSPYTMQGDCLIKKCGKFGVFKTEHASIPKGTTPREGHLVLKGQTNSHALYGGKFNLMEKDGTLFIQVKEATVLDHVKDHSGPRESAEHHAQWIPPGDYFFDGILEYDHIKEESRQVID